MIQKKVSLERKNQHIIKCDGIMYPKKVNIRKIYNEKGIVANKVQHIKSMCSTDNM